MRHKAGLSFVDGFVNGAGYALVLLVVGALRELLGEGALLGHHVMPHTYVPSLFLLGAPGAFLTLGLLIWIVKGLSMSRTPSK